jgi:hypothetical protein
MASEFRQQMSVVVTGAAVMSSLWPVVALLILLFSRSIKRALVSRPSLSTFE